MSTFVTTAVSVVALILSATTMWLTLLRGGHVKMTQPTLFYFGPDGANSEQRALAIPKVFVRTLLYSTGRRGIVVENMYVTVARGETRQNFNKWVYRDKGLLSRGSGLFVGHDGLALDHHFLLPADGTSFDFMPGDYTIQVFAKLVQDRKARLLGAFTVRLTEDAARVLGATDLARVGARFGHSS
jgi:hypothetical protein